MIFYYIRHGEPIYRPDSLTEYGKEQAEALTKRLALYGIDEIYSSPSTRALQTAQPTCEYLNRKPICLDWTNEVLAWNEFTIEESGKKNWVFRDERFVSKFCQRSMRSSDENWMDDSFFQQTNIKKGLERINAETDAFFLRLGFKHDREKGGYEVLSHNGKRIALFAHQGFGIAFLSSLLDIPYPQFCTRFDIGHTGVSVVHFDEKQEFTYPRLLQLSNDSHLYKEGLLKSYCGQIDI